MKKERYPYLSFYGHLLVWHPMCFTHMSYPHINLSWQGDACGPAVNDRLNQWDAEPRAVSWTKFTFQSSENTLWASLMLIFPVYQHNREKLFFSLKKVSQDTLMDKSRIFFLYQKVWEAGHVRVTMQGFGRRVF